jgi:putative ABC transport system permease protein
MREVICNLWRRRMRSSLTVVGIAIGIIAFSVLGSLAERMNAMIAGSTRFFSEHIAVLPKGFSTGFGFLAQTTLDAIKSVKGVGAVQANVILLMEEDQGFTLGIPPMIRGVELQAEPSALAALAVASGRMINATDTEGIAIGADIARRYGAQVGRKLRLRERDFTVVGILEKTMAGPDSMVFMPIAQARQLMVESQPLLQVLADQVGALPALPILAMSFDPEWATQLNRLRSLNLDNLATNLVVQWEPDADPEEVARAIAAAVSDVQVFSPAEMKAEISRASIILNLVLLGSAVIALLVGALSVINTMTMSVSERRAEIGLKKALGASDADILKEYLSEAGLIGLIGGLLGLAAGIAVITLINKQTAASGVSIFMPTVRLGVLAVTSSTVLGILAGVYPSLRAARLSPVVALRKE